MSAPAAVYRGAHLYTVVPELENIDIQIGANKMFIDNFSNIQSDFQTQLSNCEDITSFYTTSQISKIYVMALEEKIISANCASGETLSNLMQQKITLLEAAYSNLTSNNN
jgi:hypothetical protein